MRWFFLFIPFLFLSGCREKLRIEKFTAFGIVIDIDTEPIKIAEVLIKALDEENEEVLKKLVSSGWLLAYNFFQKGFTNIVSDKVKNGCWRILGGLKEF